jgi:hypothetical protein
MALIVSHSSNMARNANSITNRTGQSGGSIGGVKKAGSWAGNVYFRIYNQGNAYTYRIQQSTPPLRSMFLNTTRNPLQYARGSYSLTHSAILG